MVTANNEKKRNNSENGNETAAEIYQVRPDYQRFDQQNHVPRNPAAELDRRRNETLRKNIEKNVPGYGLRDWAFYTGAIPIE